MKCKLKDIVNVTMGQSPKSEFYNTTGEGVPFLQGNRTFGLKYPTFDTFTTKVTKMANAGDVIMSVRAPVGDLNITPSDVCLGRGVCSLRMKNENQEFLYYMMKYYVPKLVNMESGTVFGSVNKNDINELKIDIPADENQQLKISKILSIIDEKIKINNDINNNLEQQAMALFKSWFIDFEPFEWQVPKTWINGVLGEFVEIKRGGSPRPIQKFLSNNGFHWLKISDATCISSPFINEIKEYIIEAGLKKTVYLKSGSLVLSNSATPGLPKILDIDTCIHDGWLYFPSSKFSNEYLYLYFKHIRGNLIALGNGSVFTNLKTDILKNYPTYLPTENVLKEFDGLVQPIFSMMLSKTRETKRLAEIRDTFLPKLMSGELDVSNIEL
ncbi:restriction endonuclease subunit S [Eubacterium sp.]|uniref:restriction endonuclease subunit S n=2 Tax=Eubacterium sp. TaxID=142586 RepID=UPI0035209C00